MKLSLLADGMILYTENTRKIEKKLLELINKFNKVSGYKIIMKKISNMSIH